MIKFLHYKILKRSESLLYATCDYPERIQRLSSDEKGLVCRLESSRAIITGIKVLGLLLVSDSSSFMNCRYEHRWQGLLMMFSLRVNSPNEIISRYVDADDELNISFSFPNRKLVVSMEGPDLFLFYFTPALGSSASQRI